MLLQKSVAMSYTKRRRLIKWQRQVELLHIFVNSWTESMRLHRSMNSYISIQCIKKFILAFIVKTLYSVVIGKMSFYKKKKNKIDITFLYITHIEIWNENTITWKLITKNIVYLKLKKSNYNEIYQVQWDMYAKT
jgi:hypothetical protein